MLDVEVLRFGDPADPLELNALHPSQQAGIRFELEGTVSFKPARKRFEWQTGPDVDGAGLLRSPRLENAEATFALLVCDAPSTDAALDLVGEVVDLITLAERTPGGVPLYRKPGGATRGATYTVRGGEIDDVPVDPTSGYLAGTPTVQVRLLLDPAARGEWSGPTVLQVPATGFTAGEIIARVPAGRGDLDPDVRCSVLNTGGVPLGLVEIGVEPPGSNGFLSHSHHGLANLAAVTEFVGAPPEQAKAASLDQSWLPLVSTVTLLDFASEYRVRVRLPVASRAISLRYAVQYGDGPWSLGTRRRPPVEGPQELDLGVVALGPGPCTLRIDAISDSPPAPGYDVAIGSVWLVPVGHMTAVVSAPPQPNPVEVTILADPLNAVSPAAPLAGRSAPVGSGAWQVTHANHFTIDSTAARASAADVHNLPRSAYLPVERTAMRIAATVTGPGAGHDPNGLSLDRFGIGKLVSPTQWLGLLAGTALVGGRFFPAVGLWIDGSTSNPRAVGSTVIMPSVTPLRLTLATYASGRIVATVASVPGGTPVLVADLTLPEASPGGELNTGRPAIIDAQNRPGRAWSDFRVTEINPDPVVAYPNRTLELGTEHGARRQALSGSGWAPPPVYRGGRLTLPAPTPLGDPRIMVRVRDGAEETGSGRPAGATVEIRTRDRFLVIPR